MVELPFTSVTTQPVQRGISAMLVTCCRVVDKVPLKFPLPTRMYLPTPMKEEYMDTSILDTWLRTPSQPAFCSTTSPKPDGIFKNLQQKDIL